MPDQPAAPPPPPPAPLPPGWWHLANLSGSVAGVLKAIAAAPDVPAHWKAALKADIEARCASATPEGAFNFVYLDAHYYLEKGNAVLHYTLTPDKVL